MKIQHSFVIKINRMSAKQFKSSERQRLISQMLNNQRSHQHERQEEKKTSPKIPRQHLKSQTPNLSSTIEPSDRQLSTISNIQSTEQKVKRELTDLIEQYKQEAQKMLLNHGWDPEKQANIRKQLKKLQQEKKQRRARFEEDLKRLEDKKKALDQSTVTNNPDRQEKRVSIEKRINKIHEREKKRQEEYANFMKYYQQYKSKKPKHKIIEEEFNQKLRKEKQQKTNQHKKRLSQVYKPMDQEELQEFEQQYMNNKYQAEKQRLQNHLYEKKQEEANRQRLNRLYKGHCHSLVLQELAGQHEKQNQAKERYKRIRQYSQLVKEEHQPRARSVVETEESQEDGMMPRTERGKRVLRDKYLKGQYLGKIVSYQKESLTHEQQNGKGLQYLEYLKSLPKKPKKEEKLPPMPPIKPKSGVYKVHRQQNPLYRASRRYNSIDLSVGEGDSKSVNRVLEFMRYRQEQLKQDQKKLRHHSFKDREEWQKQQKSFNRQLVSNIEEKLEILKRM